MGLIFQIRLYRYQQFGQEARDVMEFLLVGATAVQVGTASFVNPTAAADVVRDLPGLLVEAGAKSVTEYVGSLRIDQ